MEKNEYLRQQRAKRIADLQGKCVIITDAPKRPGQILYYQNQELCNKGYWTAFLANAKGFASKEEADHVLSKLKYNNPRLTWIS